MTRDHLMKTLRDHLTDSILGEMSLEKVKFVTDKTCSVCLI